MRVCMQHGCPCGSNGTVYCVRLQWYSVLCIAVASQGPGWLYAMPAAGTLAAEVQAEGGVITVDDLLQATPEIVQPLTVAVSPRLVAASEQP